MTVKQLGIIGKLKLGLFLTISDPAGSFLPKKLASFSSLSISLHFSPD
jgi:hypothetical protein